MTFFGVLALIEMIGGIIIFLSAKTVLIEIEGLVMAGFGFLTFAVIGGCLELKRELQKSRVGAERAEPSGAPAKQRTAPFWG
jgi:hypothetical protein